MSTLYEIVELENGDIVLRRADGVGEPLVEIRFSKESRAWMQQGQLMVARAMIEAGLEAFAEIEDDDEAIFEQDGVGFRQLH